MTDQVVQIIKLPPDRWKEYKDLRLRALQDDPQAFGSSYAKEIGYSDAKWQERTTNNLFFAIDGNKLVGMVGIWQSDEDKTDKTANVFGVYVSPEFRGKGISKMMMNALLAELKNRPLITKLKLTVNKNQSAAVKLYEGFGFTVVGQENALLGDGNYYDELIMEKTL